MFFKKVNKSSRKEMIAFLRNHFRYYTMNSWNLSKSYANRVKLHDLQIPSEFIDKAYAFIEAECDDYDFDVADKINEFKVKTGYGAGFNGRSNGYIVLYDTKRENGCLHTITRGIDDNEDFEEWSIEELRERTRLVEAFDKLCDDIRDIFIDYVKSVKIETVTEMVPITKIVASIPDPVPDI